MMNNVISLDTDPVTGEQSIKLPDELFAEHGWQIGDTVEFYSEGESCLIVNRSLRERQGHVKED